MDTKYCNGTLYTVVNENTLCYQSTARQEHNKDKQIQWFDVLACSVIRGGRSPMDGAFPYSEPHDKIRPATKADFEFFRVDTKGHLA